MLLRGLFRRCPVCGGGHMFRRWFEMRSNCPKCAFDFERVDGLWLGAVATNTVVTFGSLLIALVVGIVLTAPDIPVLPLTLICVGVAAGVPLIFFPSSKTLWSAADLILRPLRPHERAAISSGAGPTHPDAD